MSTIIAGKMTVVEYLAWCERPENAERRTELVHGEIVDMGPTARLHGALCGLIGILLYDYLRQSGAGYLTTNNAGLQISTDTMRGPDIFDLIFIPVEKGSP